MEKTHSSKKIVKNTAFLYIRMLFVMGVSFFTVRIVLQSLGETDYGIYNVVGGMVTIMSFLNGSLSSSTSRFLTFSLGKNDLRKLNYTFSASLNLHICAAILVLILGETLGVWFLYNKMTIPIDQMKSAFWILQFSIITTCFSFTQIPFNASLISHEEMGVFAYIGIYEALSKLGIAYLIKLNHDQKLILYGFLIMINALIIQFIYCIYTYKHYSECRIRFVKDKKIYKELLGYSGWELFGGLAIASQGQGLNILLNVFFGPVINAARGIAVQIQGAMKQFVTNFLTAVRPRVVKLSAEENYNEMYRLTFYGCKIGYFLMYAIALPLFFQINFVLKIWLGNEIPPYTSIFAIIIILIILVDSYHSGFLMAYHAIGKIKLGNALNGSLMILSLPLSYLVLKLGYPPYSVFIVVLIVNFITHWISWIIIYHYKNFNFKELLLNVYLRTIIVSILSLIIPFVITSSLKEGWFNFLFMTLISEVIYFYLILKLGFNKQETEDLIIPIYYKIKNKIKI